MTSQTPEVMKSDLTERGTLKAKLPGGHPIGLGVPGFLKDSEFRDSRLPGKGPSQPTQLPLLSLGDYEGELVVSVGVLTHDEVVCSRCGKKYWLVHSDPGDRHQLKRGSRGA